MKRSELRQLIREEIQNLSTSDNYRESVEGRMRTNLEHLIMRSELPKNEIVLGGDKYLKKDLNLKINTQNQSHGGTIITINNLPPDIIKLASEAESQLLGGEVNQDFEKVIESLQEIYNLPEDIFESSFWVEQSKLIFDTGN